MVYKKPNLTRLHISKYKKYICSISPMPTIVENHTTNILENECMSSGFSYNESTQKYYTNMYNDYYASIIQTNIEQEIKNILFNTMHIWTQHQILNTNTVYKNMSLQKKLFILDKNIPLFRKQYIAVIHYMYKYNIYSPDALLLALNTYVSNNLSQTNVNSISLWVNFNVNYVKFLPKTKNTLKYFGNFLQKTNKLISSVIWLEFIPFKFLQEIKDIQTKFLETGYVVDVLTINKCNTLYINNINNIQNDTTLDIRIKLLLLNAEKIVKTHNMLCADVNYVKKPNYKKLQLLNSNNTFVHTYTSILYYITKSSQYSKTAFTLALQKYLLFIDNTTQNTNMAWRILQADYTKYINAELYNFSSEQLNKLWHKTYHCVKFRTF